MRGMIIAVVTLAPSVAVAGLRCQDTVVSEGRTTYEVEKRCGEPFHVESTVEARTIRRYHPRIGYVERRETVPIERWTYVASEHDLVRTLVFENGKLAQVRTEGRPPRGEGSVERCRTAIHTSGDTTAEVLLRCGAPSSIHRWFEEIAEGTRHYERRVLVPHERWIYDLGDQYLLRIMTFSRGRLVDQKTARR
jgi:hypothetical protein